jgi:hypothetical protein
MQWRYGYSEPTVLSFSAPLSHNTFIHGMYFSSKHISVASSDTNFTHVTHLVILRTYFKSRFNYVVIKYWQHKALQTGAATFAERETDAEATLVMKLR